MSIMNLSVCLSITWLCQCLSACLSGEFVGVSVVLVEFVVVSGAVYMVWWNCRCLLLRICQWCVWQSDWWICLYVCPYYSDEFFSINLIIILIWKIFVNQSENSLSINLKNFWLLIWWICQWTCLSIWRVLRLSVIMNFWVSLNCLYVSLSVYCLFDRQECLFEE